ncbi:DUF6702 family protein [Solirubrum puertoriconensis]|uniref:Uncharacterized protein n=1 Tax=Solirubrum puertoriconensis TaxID=1751427 RepID=A0A9X0HIY8_SOLP1|nr:DUF6702 family protein [Solirubrum puertoriconensis]KUG06766.1 hypothetical protein ASU33_05390 [Solirubrum puertoriconensis]
MRRFVVFLGALLITLAAWAHPYHASIMEAKLNSKTQQLEIALKVFTDDLETGLSQGAARPLRLLETPAAQLTPVISNYLRRSITVGTKPGEALPLNYLGMEREKDAHWIYFSVKLNKRTQAINLSHRLLMEQFSDQMNIVNLEANGKKQSALFRSGNETQRISL